MDKTGTLQLLATLKAAYPNFYQGQTESNMNVAVNLWAEMFADDDPAIVAAAVKALIATDTKGFPPSIGAVKAKIRQITTPEEMTEQEAWGLVYKALGRSLYNAQEAFDALPRNVQSIVGTASQLRDWAMLDSGTVQSVIASNFQRSYRARAAYDREYAALPSDVKQIADSLAGRLGLDSGGNVDAQNAKNAALSPTAAL